MGSVTSYHHRIIVEKQGALAVVCCQTTVTAIIDQVGAIATGRHIKQIALDVGRGISRFTINERIAASRVHQMQLKAAA